MGVMAEAPLLPAGFAPSALAFAGPDTVVAFSLVFSFFAGAAGCACITSVWHFISNQRLPDGAGRGDDRRDNHAQGTLRGRGTSHWRRSRGRRRLAGLFVSTLPLLGARYSFAITSFAMRSRPARRFVASDDGGITRMREIPPCQPVRAVVSLI